MVSNADVMVKRSILLGCCLLLLASCQNGRSSDKAEDKEAKQLLQGVWSDADTEEMVFRVKGDSIYYADKSALPTYFRIANQQLYLGAETSYSVVKQTPNQFWFTNQNGDVVKLVRSTEQSDDLAYTPTDHSYAYTEVVKTDSVVMYGDQRYHWYVAINPTKYKVMKRAYSDDGIEVENVYYDNIIHLSVFQGSTQIFSSDLRKQLFGAKVPKSFLEHAVLGNVEYVRSDQHGMHFDVTLCIPDEAQCYVVDFVVGWNGQRTMKLVEY